MKINARLIVAAATAVAAVARLFAAHQASQMPPVRSTAERRKADVLPFKGKDRRK